MIRSSAQRRTIDAKAARLTWMSGALYVLLSAVVFLAPLPASAGGAKADQRAARHTERLQRHETRRRDVPHNARYKNPPRQGRSRRENRSIPSDRSRLDGRARSYDRRHDGRGRHEDRHDRARRDDHRRGKYDGRYRHGKPGHHHNRHRYRTRVYHHYEYVPYYAPVVVAYPYYCDLCHSGFYAEHLFYDHLCFVHRLSRALIPGLVYWYGGTFIFGGW